MTLASRFLPVGPHPFLRETLNSRIIEGGKATVLQAPLALEMLTHILMGVSLAVCFFSSSSPSWSVMCLSSDVFFPASPLSPKACHRWPPSSLSPQTGLALPSSIHPHSANGSSFLHLNLLPHSYTTQKSII